MTLENFYKNCKNPLKDNVILRKIVEFYLKSKKDGRDLYNYLIRSNTNKNPYHRDFSKERDDFYVKMINLWIESLSKNSTGFAKYASKFPKINSLKDYENFINGNGDPKIRNALQSLPKFDNGAFQGHFFHVDSTRFDFSSSERRQNIEHRLYLNIAHEDIYKFSDLVIEKCHKKGLPYYFKFGDPNNSNSDYRTDSWLLYSNTDNLLKYNEILEEVIKENPDIASRIGQAPMLTSKVNNYIGYGSEPENTGSSSFNSKREDVLNTAVGNSIYTFMKNNYKKYETKIVDNICSEIIKKYQDLKGNNKHFQGNINFSNQSNRNKLFYFVQKDIENYFSSNNKYSYYPQCLGDDGKLIGINVSSTYLKILNDNKVFENQEFFDLLSYNIDKESEKTGIDTNNFAFDVTRVKQMQYVNKQNRVGGHNKDRSNYQEGNTINQYKENQTRNENASIDELKYLFEKYKLNLDGRDIHLIDRSTNNIVNLGSKQDQMSVIQKLILAEKWIESAGYGLSLSGNKNELGIDARQYEYAFNEQAKETFSLLINKMQDKSRQGGGGIEIFKIAEEIAEETKYKYSKNLIEGLLSNPNKNTPDGFNKIMSGVPEKETWQLNAMKKAIRDICATSRVNKSNIDANSFQMKNDFTHVQQSPQNTSQKSNETNDSSQLMRNNDLNISNGIIDKSTVENKNKAKTFLDNKDQHNQSVNISVKSDIVVDEFNEDKSTIDKDIVDKKTTTIYGQSIINNDNQTIDYASSELKNKNQDILPIMPYVSNMGAYKGKWDKFLEFLDKQVEVNNNLLNKGTIKKPFINMDAVYSLLLDKCKTQMDYLELETILNSVKSLGGIGSGYCDVCMRFLSKIHAGATSDEEVESNKLGRLKSIKQINNNLSNDSTYSKLSLDTVFEEIESFEESPSVQCQDKLCLVIRYALSKCENQEDLNYLEDYLEHMSSYAIYSSEFVIFNKNMSLQKELNSEFSDFTLKFNQNNIKVLEDMYQKRYGVKIDQKDYKNTENQKVNKDKLQSNEEFQGKDIPTKENKKVSKDIHSLYEELSLQIIICFKILLDGKFIPSIKIFKSFDDIEQFVNSLPTKINDIKESISQEEYDRLEKGYKKMLSLYTKVKTDRTSKMQAENITTKLVEEIDAFIKKVKLGINGSNGQVEFDAEQVKRKSIDYRNKLWQEQKNIESNKFNQLNNELQIFLNTCSMADDFYMV